MKAKLIKTEGSYILKDGLLHVVGVDDKNLKERLNCNYLLSTKNCQAIENGYDLDELVEGKYPNVYNEDYEYDSEAEMLRDEYKSRGFREGAKAILEILGDKKFSEENMLKAFITGIFTDETSDHDFEFTELMKDLQQTEWDVEIVMEYVGECKGNNNDGCFQDSPGHDCGCYEYKLKLDTDGCLILKRV